jgi:putative flippase GtrA
LRNKIVRFVLVGILNTLFGYSVFAFCIFLHIHYSQALLLVTVIGALFNFKTTGGIVFKSSDNRLIFKFVGVYLVMYLFNLIALKSCAYIGVNMYVAGFLVAFPSAVISFMLFNTFVFRGKPVIPAK